MSARINIQNADSQSFNAMLALQAQVNKCGLESSLLELVKMRASQINRCAHCIDMHSRDARAHGETEQRLYALNAWEETPFYSERERAALAWSEVVTQISIREVSDELFQQVRRHFSEQELVSLTLAVTTINAWNRLCVAFRIPPGSHEPAKR